MLIYLVCFLRSTPPPKTLVQTVTLLSPTLPTRVVGWETLHEIPSWFPNAFWRTCSQRCRGPGRRRWWEHGAVLMCCTPHTVLVLLNSGQRLCLPQEPPKGFMSALPLQLCSNHFPALLMVLVHPVTLERGRGRTFSTNRREFMTLQVMHSQKHL